ncbi:MAG: peptidylprolyl isomerase [Bacteroidetes bacterium]|nr:peptidylprolyl isomerase [Bacteroidota bacterium]MBS1739634.1 peptidylprolyl isomerase [Bacteroidota bacterium]
MKQQTSFLSRLGVFLCFFFLNVSANAQSSKIVIETDSGKIVMELFDNTPLHRDNILKLVKDKFFDSTLFHRVIPNFVIQGGDPDSKHAAPGVLLGEGELGYRIPAEINDSNFHQRGALGMARDANPEKASSASQFYIVVGKVYSDAELDKISQRTGRQFSSYQREVYKTIGGTPGLDGNYTIFGIVVEGMDVVDKIVNMPRNQADRPNTDIAMRSVYLFGKKPTEKKKRR